MSNLQRERKLVVLANEVLSYVNECKINTFPLVSIINRVFFYLKIYRGSTSFHLIMINGVRSGPKGYSVFQTTGMIEGFLGFEILR